MWPDAGVPVEAVVGERLQLSQHGSLEGGIGNLRGGGGWVGAGGTRVTGGGW